MRVQLPLRGPIKWLVVLAVVWAYPVALVYGFAPETDAGKEALYLLGLYFAIPVVLVMILAVLNLGERAWKSWQHWQRTVHQPGTPFLLGESVTTHFSGEHIAPFMLCFILNAMVCIVGATIIQVVMKFIG